MRPGFRIDMKGRHIFEVREVSRRFVGHLTEAAFRELMAERRPRLFLWATADRLTELPPEWVETLLPGQIVPDPDGFDLAACPNGCCYVAMLWKGEHGAPVVVMQENH